MTKEEYKKVWIEEACKGRKPLEEMTKAELEDTEKKAEESAEYLITHNIPFTLTRAMEDAYWAYL